MLDLCIPPEVEWDPIFENGNPGGEKQEKLFSIWCDGVMDCAYDFCLLGESVP